MWSPCATASNLQSKKINPSSQKEHLIFSLADGTYTASEQGCLSEVAVTVTVTGGKVTNVAIDASGETPELGGAAAETLADALTKAGSTNGVDAVSGATLTSEAVFTAMNDCLSQAQ